MCACTRRTAFHIAPGNSLALLGLWLGVLGLTIPPVLELAVVLFGLLLGVRGYIAPSRGAVPGSALSSSLLSLDWPLPCRLSSSRLLSSSPQSPSPHLPPCRLLSLLPLLVGSLFSHAVLQLPLWLARPRWTRLAKFCKISPWTVTM